MDETSQLKQQPSTADASETPVTDTLPSVDTAMASETATTTPPADAPVTVDTGLATDALSSTPPLSLSDPLLDFLQVGGPVVWILLGFSVVALSIVLIKLWQFARLRPECSGDIETSLSHWQAGQTSPALEALKPRRPASELVALAMQGLSDESRDLPLLKDELERVATLRLNQLRALLRPLDVIATLSPLLGLLGTVLGMIVAFQQMEAAGNQVDPSVLSGGIWQALLTTAVGLAVAIPVVTVHNWLERKTERVAALMNDAVTRVFTGRPGKLKLAEAGRHAA